MEVDKLSSSINKFSAEFCKEVDEKSSAVSSPLSAELVLALLALGATGRSHDEILQALHLQEEVDEKSSAVSSPLSAELVLALLALGARGRSHDEILQSLHLPDDAFVRTGFTTITAKLTKVKGITLNIANKVYLKDGPYELKSSFKDDAVKVFGADVEKINFDNGAAAADAINKWVEGKTNSRIKDLISADSINTDTRLILVNALYFKGSWKNPFDPKSTTDGPFHVNSKQTINILFMALETYVKYGWSKELDATLLEMPYEGEESSLLVLLPNELEGLGLLLDTLATGADLEVARNDMRYMEVNVRLPKFKIETTIDLKVLLPKLGIKSIFDPKNKDLLGLLENPEPLYVSQAVQKVFIEVNEEGAEAAAATDYDEVRFHRLRLRPLFIADRPFYFALLAGSTVLFTGIFNPSK